MSNLPQENQPQTGRRRGLLPLWIKVFVWIFMICGLIIPIMIISELMGMVTEPRIYGLESASPFSLMGIGIILIYLLKVVVAGGLWVGKDWAVKLAKIDAILGMCICFLMMAVLTFQGSEDGIMLNFRLELIALIPYFLQMRKLEYDWDHFHDARREKN